MNYAVSLLLLAGSERIAQALQYLNEPGGRPVFEDEIKPEWSDVYAAIKWMEPPKKVARHGLYLLMEWYEVDRSARAYISWLERAGAIVVFDYARGEIAEDDERIPEDAEDQHLGIYHLRVNNRMQRLTRENLKELIPKCRFEWSDDLETNIRNVAHYIQSVSP